MTESTRQMYDRLQAAPELDPKIHFTEAQLTDARRQGAADERARLALILRDGAAQERKAMAMSLAFDTDLPPDQAGKVLAAAPKAQAEKSADTGFERAMAKVPNPTVGPNEGEDDGDEVDGLVQRARRREERA